MLSAHVITDKCCTCNVFDYTNLLGTLFEKTNSDKILTSLLEGAVPTQPGNGGKTI